MLRCNIRVNAFVFPSTFTMRQFIAAGFPPEKCFHIPTFVDTANIEYSPVNEGQILYFGRIVEEKGVHLLLQAYASLVGKKPRLIIVGCQDDIPYNRTLISTYGDRVDFKNFMTKQELSLEIRKAMCVVIPSIWYDNLPNVLLEAYAHGRPVIAPNHGSFLELDIHEKTGLLFEAGSQEALRSSLAWAIANPSAMATMGARARIAAETEFSPSLHLDRLIALFSSCCEPRLTSS